MPKMRKEGSVIEYFLLLYLGAELQLGPVWQTVCGIGLCIQFVRFLIGLLKDH